MPDGPKYPATLHRVIDGDTFWLTMHVEREVWPGIVYRADLTFPIRLLLWDTPERGETNYREAIDFSSARLSEGPISVEWPVGMSFNRYVCAVWIGDRLLGELLEEAGLAVPLTKMRVAPLPDSPIDQEFEITR